MSVTNAWVEFGGVRSDNSALGLKMLSYPKRTRSQRNGKSITIPGRSGDVFVDYGSSATVSVKVDFMLTDLSKLSAVNQWLQGSSLLRLGDMDNRAYKARCEKSFTYTPSASRSTMQKITVEWTCQPWLYKYPAEATTTYNTSGQGKTSEYTVKTFTNPLNTASAPLIEVITDTTGMDFTLSLYQGDSATALWECDFESVAATDILIDGELQDAVKSDYSAYLNQYMDGDYPVIPVGTSTLKLSNVKKGSSTTVNVTQIKVTPRWRDL